MIEDQHQPEMPLKQLFKRNSIANLDQDEPGSDTSYYSSFPKTQRKQSSSSNNHNNNNNNDNSSSNYSSSPHSTVDSFLPKIDINEEDEFMMDFIKKDAPLPPLPGNDKNHAESVKLGHQQPHYLQVEPSQAYRGGNEIGNHDDGDGDDDDDDDDNNSIQASPVIYDEPEVKKPKQQKYSYQSSSSTLPSHFSNNSSASSSTTVDSVPNHIIPKHNHTPSNISYSNPADAETARQFWTYHHAQHPSVTSYAGATGQAGSTTEKQDDEEDEDLFEDKVTKPTSRVKSMFPQLSFYKPLQNPDEEYSQEKEIEEGESEGLVNSVGRGTSGGHHLEAPAPPGTGLYDGSNNDSTLSFNESSQNTEQDLERKKSLPDANNTMTASTSIRRSLASPVKSFNRLKNKSSRTFSKKLVFSENNSTETSPSSASPAPPVPSVSLNTSSFGQSFVGGEESSNITDQENRSPQSSKNHYKLDDKEVTPKQQPLPSYLAGRSGQDSDEDDEDEEDNLLPLSPLAPPTRSSTKPGPTGMVMTKSQFDSYRKSVIESGLTSPINSKDKDGAANGDRDAEDDEDEDEDDEDGSDRGSDDEESKKHDKYVEDRDSKKQSINMRLKQDAHLSVYRQKMSKVTGSQTALSSYNNSGMRGSQSFGNLDSVVMSSGGSGDGDDDDEYDDIPLGILKAHGFPANQNGGNLRPMSSHPNLGGKNVDELGGASTGPGILYQGKSPADSQSLRSANSNSNLRPGVDIRASAPLPPAFNTTNHKLNRGLIGEIEDEKKRRQSVHMGGMLNQRASAILPSSQSVNGLSANDPMQQQMQQMMQMQMQILQQMAGNGGASTNGSTANGSTGLKKNWSSMDMMNGGGQSLTPPPQPQAMGRPASIRSFSSERSGRPMSAMPNMQHQGHGHNRNSSQPALKDLANQEMYRMSRSQSSPYIYQAPMQQPMAHQQPMSRPPSTMRLVQPANIEEEDGDDDEDDEAWEEMLRKRQGLKESWKNRGIAA